MTYVLLAWLLGTLAAVLWLVVAQLRFSRSLGVLLPLSRRGDVEILLSPAVDAPVALGVFRRCVVLPDGFARLFTAEQQRLILDHELAHHQRFDLLANALAELFRCVFWFHPLVHLGLRYFRMDQELATDEQVLRGHDRSARVAYGAALIEAGRLQTVAVARWASPRRVLNARLRHLGAVPVTHAARLAGGAGVAALTLGVAGLVWGALPPPAPSFSTGTLPLDAELTEAELAQNVMYAARTGDHTTLANLLTLGAATDFAAPEQGTPLIVAARSGDLRAVQLLLDHGADINAGVLTAGSALIVAAKHDRREVAKLLIRSGSSVNQHVFLDETPLINAARFGHTEMARMLIDAGADVDQSVTTFSITHLPLGTKSPVSEATRVGHADMVALLNGAG